MLHFEKGLKQHCHHRQVVSSYLMREATVCHTVASNLAPTKRVQRDLSLCLLAGPVTTRQWGQPWCTA